jgi:16S rRNA (adenine1518-N6/adenine1519-N6)-dimethyltransferase
LKRNTGGRTTRRTDRAPAGHRRRGIRPARRPRTLKRLGQHYLASAWAARIVDAVDPQPGDVFLEIGPGTGALTLPLAAAGAPILAIEIDRRLSTELLPRLPPNVTMLTADILSADVIPYLSGLEPQRAQSPGDATARPRFRIVGNLPYYIASPILFRLIELHRKDAIFSDATLMVQREVADRLVARPGTKAYGVLTILLGVHTRITRLFDVPPGAFTPRPEVYSTVVRLRFGDPPVFIADLPLLERLVKALFGQRRKTLLNALKRFDPTGAAVLALSRIDGRRRPETLTLEELAQLTALIASVRRPAML